jgi:hypothetical protein
MRNILALLGAAVVAFLIVGWYLGWYQVSNVPTAHGPQSVHVDINPTKISDDVKKGVEKGEQIVDSLRQQPADGKPAQATGPASNFFSPSPSPVETSGSSSGWRPIGGSKSDDEGSPRSRNPRN